MKVAELLYEDEETIDIKSIADEHGFSISSEKLFLAGKKREVTVLSGEQTIDGVDISMRYLINPETSAWSFQACPAGQDNFIEMHTGEDTSTLVKHLKKKKKLTPHQVAEYMVKESAE
jgi:hypothetical protein